MTEKELFESNNSYTDPSDVYAISQSAWQTMNGIPFSSQELIWPTSNIPKGYHVDPGANVFIHFRMSAVFEILHIKKDGCNYVMADGSTVSYFDIVDSRLAKIYRRYHSYPTAEYYKIRQLSDVSHAHDIKLRSFE